MIWRELQNQALQLSISDRWRLVQSLLTSIQQETIQQETLSLDSSNSSVKPVPDLDSWTQSLMGVIQSRVEESTESYVDYLEEKYR